jgi:hypothetical protein
LALSNPNSISKKTVKFTVSSVFIFDLIHGSIFLMAVRFNHKIMAAVKREVAKQIIKETYGVDAEAKRLILETPKTGRLYPRGDRVHQASAPGEPFASDTGNAINQIQVSFKDENLTGIVRFGAEYALALEFGTVKMAPRPVARPALANKKEAIEQGIKAAVKRGMNG